MNIQLKDQQIIDIFRLFLEGNPSSKIAEKHGLTIYRVNKILRDQSNAEIVSPSVFNLAQEELEKRAKNPHTKHPLVGILFCGKCGKPMTCQKRKYKENIYRHYQCSTYRMKGRAACPQENMDADQLEYYVYQSLREQLQPLRGLLNSEEIQKRLEQIDARIKEIDEEMESIKQKTLQVVLDKDKLTEAQYQYLMEQLKEKSLFLEEKKNNLITGNDIIRMKGISKYLDEIDELDPNDKEKMRNLLHIFIDSVYVNGDAISINYKFKQFGLS